MRPSLRDSEIRAQSGMAPRQFFIGEWIVVAVAIAAVALLIIFLT
jgi:hypothetical protein